MCVFADSNSPEDHMYKLAMVIAIAHWEQSHKCEWAVDRSETFFLFLRKYYLPKIFISEKNVAWIQTGNVLKT